MSKKNSPIHIDVSLDENNIPELIQWSAPDGGIDKEFAQAMFLALWDGKSGNLKDGSLDKRNACRSNENIFSSDIGFNE